MRLDLSQNRSRGITLIEIMVALVASSFIVAGAFGLLAAQRPTYARQREIQERQQNLWLAMEFLQRDFRLAGMGMASCQTPHANTTAANFNDVFKAEVLYFSGADVRVLHAVEVLDNQGTNGNDVLTLRYFDPSAMPGAGSAASVLTGSASMWTSPTTGVATGNVAANPTSAFMTPANCTCVGGTVCSGTTALGLAVLMAPFPTPSIPPTHACVLAEVSGVASGCQDPSGSAATGLLQIVRAPTIPQPGVALPTNPAPAANSNVMNLPPNTTVTPVGALITRVYSILWDNASSPPQPSLVRSENGGPAQLIADGIEDMQIVPACDVNHDGQIGVEGTGGGRTSDEWLGNIVSDPAFSPQCTTFPQARITLVARTGSPDPGNQSGQRPALENHIAGSADQFHRRVLSSVAQAPNVPL